MKKQTIIIIILGILLLGTIGYIIQDKYIDSKVQQGIQIGYQQAIIDIVQRAVMCQQVPLRIGNETINIIAVDCIN